MGANQDYSKAGFGTKAIHAGVSPDPTTGAIMTPIFQTSTYVQESPGKHKGFEYSRTHNPTRNVLHENLAALENGKYAIAFSSGMAAVETVIKTLKPGDEVVAANDLYGGTYRLFTKVWADFGIKFHFADLSKPDNLLPYLNQNTKVVWVETPTNPLLGIIDIAGLAQHTQKHGAYLVVDNTFATPYLQNPLDLGADVVMHSLTKYMAGHSDVVMGALITKHQELAERFQYLMNATGNNPGPMDAWLVLRGLKTLHVRMERHCANAKKIAQYLVEHPLVENVFYPGLSHHPNHEVAKTQMRDFGGMISFILKGDDLAHSIRVMERFKLFALGESLGGVESICTHPASMTHASVPREEREKTGFKDSLIRLSVGIEDYADLEADLAQALKG